MKKVQFSKPQGEFFSTLRKSVQNYFDENQLQTSGDWKLYLKAAIIITTYIAIYLTIMLLPIPGYVALLLSASLGFVQALVGFNIMHDACHEAFSSNKKVN